MRSLAMLGLAALLAGFGADRVIGGPRADRLSGGFGNDRVEGRGGPDRLRGEHDRQRRRVEALRPLPARGGGPKRPIRERLMLKVTPQRVKDLRRAYVTDVRAIKNLVDHLRATNVPEEYVARFASVQRRIIGYHYKKLTPQPFRYGIYRRNMKKYDDPLGPTYDWFKKEGRSDAAIIDSSMRPSGKDLGLAGMSD